MRVRRPHLARTVNALLIAIGLWCLLVFAAFRIVSLPGVRAKLAREIAARLATSIGQEVRIGDVELAPIPPSVTIHDLSVGPAERPMLLAGECEVTSSQLRLAERELVLGQVRLQHVRVDATLPSLPAGSSKEPWFRILVRQLELQDVRVERLALPSGLDIEIRDLEARWNGSPRAPVSAAVVHAGGFEVRIPGVEPIAGSLAAWGRRTAQGWEVRMLRAQGPGWEVAAKGDGTWSGGAHATGTTSVDLATLDRTLRIGAGLEGQARLAWELSLAAGAFRVDTEVACSRAGVVGFTFTDVDGEVHLSQDGLETTLRRAVFAEGELEGSYTLGELGPPWSHRIAIRGDQIALGGFLHQLGVNDAGLAGRCRINADVGWEGRGIKAGSGTAVVDMRAGEGDVPVAGRAVLSLAGDGAMQISASGVTVGSGAVDWDGRLTLGDWIPSWDLRGEHVRIATIARLLEGWVGTTVIPPELNGETVLEVTLKGPFRDLTVTGDVAAAPLAYGPVDTDGLEATFRVGQGVLTVSSATVFVGSGRVVGQGELRYGEGDALQVGASGRGVPLSRMIAWGGVRAPLAGRVDFTGSLCGTLEAPGAEAQLSFSGVSLAGVSFGDGKGRVSLDQGVVNVEDLAIGPFAAHVGIDMARREALVEASLHGFGLEGVSAPLSRIVGGSLDCKLSGSFPFDAPAGHLEVTTASGARGTLELDRKGLRVEVERPGIWRVAGRMEGVKRAYRGHFDVAVTSLRQLGEEVAGAPVPFDGALAGGMEVAASPGNLPTIDGEVASLSVVVEDESATLEEPAHFSINGGAVRLAGATLVGPHSRLFVSGERSTGGELSGSLFGEFPAPLLGLVWRQANPRGRVEVQGQISGTDSAPRFEGMARVRDGAITLPGLPTPATNINGTVELVPGVFKLVGMQFTLSGGHGTCEGRVAIDPRLELDLGVHAESVRWPLITGFSPILTADIRVTGPLDRLSVGGDAVLQRTIYRQPLNLQRLVLQQIRAPQRVTSADTAPVSFNVLVKVPGTLEVNTEIARLSARGELRIVGTSAEPGVLGRLEVLPGGELELSGVRYEIDRGTVTFASPDRIEPFLDVLARATVQNYDITVGLVGTLDRMTPTFTSNPPLPEMDIVSLLLVGRRADEAGQTQAGAAASTFLAEQLTGAVTRRARTLFDVDQLRVDPFADTTSGTPSARLTVVKQLSADWTVSVATNLSSNREELVSSRYQFAPGVFLVATRDVDGSYSLDVKWQRRY